MPFVARHGMDPDHGPNKRYQPDGEPDYTDVSKTENTRVSYPIYHIHNYEPSGMGKHPDNVIFLTCDAFGVLPPVSRLSPEQVRLVHAVHVRISRHLPLFGTLQL